MKFYEALEVAMRKRGVRPADLARESGVSKSYLSDLKAGRMSDPSFGRASAIVHALGMTLDEFAAIQDGADSRGLTADEHELLASYRSMDAAGKKAALGTVAALRQTFGQDSSPSAPAERSA